MEAHARKLAADKGLDRVIALTGIALPVAVGLITLYYQKKCGDSTDEKLDALIKATEHASGAREEVLAVLRKLAEPENPKFPGLGARDDPLIDQRAETSRGKAKRPAQQKATNRRAD